MTLCLLIRHAAHDLLGRVLVGRQDGVPINAAGREQARDLARRLQPLRITRIQSSPRERALQTASPIAERTGLAIETCAALDEVDFGAWTGYRFDDLARDRSWQRWNAEREHARAPGGESIAEVQARIVAQIQSMHAQEPGGRIVMVAHAEVIRAAVLHCMGTPLGAWATIDIPPASIIGVRVRPRRRVLVDLEELAAA